MKELLDPEVIHQAELVVSKRIPGVAGRDRSGGFAAIGVALVHGDAVKLVLENLERVEHGIRPVADAGVQSAAGHQQQRKATAGFLITDSDVTSLVERHGKSSRHEFDQD